MVGYHIRAAVSNAANHPRDTDRVRMLVSCADQPVYTLSVGRSLQVLRGSASATDSRVHRLK